LILKTEREVGNISCRNTADCWRWRYFKLAQTLENSNFSQSEPYRSGISTVKADSDILRRSDDLKRETEWILECRCSSLRTCQWLEVVTWLIQH
jgi:hypothetical protein